jgi:hypothetical protein
VQRLQKPNAEAWLLNQVARGKQLARVFALGDALVAANRELLRGGSLTAFQHADHSLRDAIGAAAKAIDATISSARARRVRAALYAAAIGDRDTRWEFARGMFARLPERAEATFPGVTPGRVFAPPPPRANTIKAATPRGAAEKRVAARLAAKTARLAAKTARAAAKATQQAAAKAAREAAAKAKRANVLERELASLKAQQAALARRIAALETALGTLRR